LDGVDVPVVVFWVSKLLNTVLANSGICPFDECNRLCCSIRRLKNRVVAFVADGLIGSVFAIFAGIISAAVDAFELLTARFI
jgi:hypothetical protein